LLLGLFNNTMQQKPPTTGTASTGTGLIGTGPMGTTTGNNLFGGNQPASTTTSGAAGGANAGFFGNNNGGKPGEISNNTGTTQALGANPNLGGQALRPLISNPIQPQGAAVNTNPSV
jgi:hypothetical protein